MIGREIISAVVSLSRFTRYRAVDRKVENIQLFAVRLILVINGSKMSVRDKINVTMITNKRKNK